MPIITAIKKIQAVNRAKKILLDNPYDVYHTYDHHLNVWQNCICISRYVSGKMDLDTLEISSWWHDVFKGRQDESELIVNELKNLNFEKETTNRILQQISEHTFGEEQTSIESKILFDADKIELISMARWKHAFDLFEAELITKQERDKYVAETNKRIPLLVDNLHFDFSNGLFKARLQQFIDWLASISRYTEGKII